MLPWAVCAGTFILNALMLAVLLLALCLLQPQSTGVARQGDTATHEVNQATGSASQISQLKSDAQGGDPAAQAALGRAYQDANGVPRDYALAAKWYRKAADQGSAIAQNNLGNMYAAGNGVEKNPEEAVSWYRKSARQGNAAAMFNLGAAYYNGEGVPVEDTTAFGWFLPAQLAGNSSAPDAVNRANSELSAQQLASGLRKISAMYIQGDLPKEFPQLIQWFRQQAESGNVAAQVNLAMMLIWDRSEKDYSQILDWCEAAGKRNDGAGYLCLAEMYRYGLGTARDAPRAMKMYRKASEYGQRHALLALGMMYLDGETAHPDRVEAFMSFMGAGLEDGAACEALKLRREMDDREWKRAKKRLEAMRINTTSLEKVLQFNCQPTT